MTLTLTTLILEHEESPAEKLLGKAGIEDKDLRKSFLKFAAETSYVFGDAENTDFAIIKLYRLAYQKDQEEYFESLFSDLLTRAYSIYEQEESFNELNSLEDLREFVNTTPRERSNTPPMFYWSDVEEPDNEVVVGGTSNGPTVVEVTTSTDTVFIYVDSQTREVTSVSAVNVSGKNTISVDDINNYLSDGTEEGLNKAFRAFGITDSSGRQLAFESVSLQGLIWEQ